MKLGPLQFLAPLDGGRDGDKVLVIGSGSMPRVTRLVDGLREKFPNSRLSVLVRRGAQESLPRREGVEYVPNEGPKPAFVQRLRAERFDRAFVLLADEPGYWKLKALAPAVGAGALYGVNENFDWFPLDVKNSHLLAAHLRWRMESSLRQAGGQRSGLVSAALKALAYPATLAYLVAYERGAQLQARARGATPWKRENRPGGERGKA
ncbi:glycosyltransferase family 9 protein [Anaeromyxobacter paludicola]|uniref:Uncharacterized protein n=1 Tax=Anaeromyxobacter paludicola TaxID=2918171 RepID=A0ABM7X5U5_9BACT|nr:hypothetical protein [Anaeromyxobacter paludicola]BDG07183.1 hypothetical protein AMPC_02960 [Anaeromyxobacter paludicola]